MKKFKTKFKCTQVSLFEHGEVIGFEITTHGAKENKSITSGAASGEAKLRIDANCAAAGFFMPGEEYFFEFSKAPKTIVPQPKVAK